ncbi:unnamed protein product [[Candida] boidinii]|uniref:Unnamed protein product n=1 Tax=Candida boidinii TaxID=5477 RepID=A0A9W6WDU4_CANBO|nr:hypothetical protein BVG19_g2216 [[Candida] boidinii]OWB50709.1 hypothetical protein B5S27_g2261 [[Candida] boidinii]OWB65274.1 hypothetical protein B5S30_g598 [[Candida] boidinii]OWB83012.1 hypothetical protein B5S33_g1641 [[Candida] boidinii]GME66830.1 unnamed protein product [[Candida] boidinii]
MDIILEVADSLILDKLYAKVLPKSFEKYVPETPEIIEYLSDVINNGTKFANDVYENSPKIKYLVENIPSSSIAAKGKEIYGLNAKYHFFEENSFTHASLLERYNLIRQSLTLFVLLSVFGWLLYFAVASVSFIFVYDKANFNHPRYLKNQVKLEIIQASTAIPVMVLLTVPWFLLELHGYSKLYYNIDESTGGWSAILFQLPAFIMFTDCCIYFIHRWLHWPIVYKLLHKPHHKWIVCTPFASHAFHPVDGYAQSLPYHWYPFLFPLHKVSYLVLFTFVNFWTVMIHDGEYLSNDPVVNGAACHTVHHLYFNYNYGQFTTLWDRLGGSYRKPEEELFNKKLRLDKNSWKKQIAEVDRMIDTVEGNEKTFRLYKDDDSELKKRKAKK